VIRARSLVFALVLGSACGTDLVLRQTEAAGPWPGGIPVNARAAFQSSVAIDPRVGLELDPSLPVTRTSGVDPVRLLSVDIRRQPFANGKVSLDLDELQRLKQVTISSESGVANGLTAASKVIGAAEPGAAGK
jgi:hypothetical protein